MDVRNEVRDWLNRFDWDTEITLTFANDISRLQAETALRRFWNRVDTALYGNAAKRFGKKCYRANIIQGDGLVIDYHFHIIAKCPTDRFNDIKSFCAFLRKQWLLDNRNNYITSIGPLRNKIGYENYISRKMSANDCDALILDSSHIPAAN